MRRIFNKIVILMATIVGVCMTGCNDTQTVATNSTEVTVTDEQQNHQHTYTDEWSSDSTYHWHNSTCGHNVVSDKALHTFSESVTKPTYQHGGYTTHFCTVCHYSFIDNDTSSIPITVIWKNWDGEILETDANVSYGSIPSYDGTTPIKPSDAQYSYSFIGWSPSVVQATKDAIYVAQYSNSVNHYTITWNVDGNISTENYAYGETPLFKGDTTKESDAQFTYSFNGWSPSIDVVTQDTTYIAQYTSSLKEYEITWKNYDGEVLYQTNSPYGTLPTYNGVMPQKPGDEQYSYVFSNWSPEISAVVGDTTYYAEFENILFDNIDLKTLSISRTSNKPSDVELFHAISSSNKDYIFKTNNASIYTNGVVRLDNNGYLLNSSALDGLSSLNIKFTGELLLEYGWYYSGQIHYEVFNESLTSDVDYTFRNNDHPSFIRLTSTTSTYIESINIDFAEIHSFNRYESDGVQCANTDLWLNYNFADDTASVSNVLKTDSVTDKNVVIRHWYNGRPVTKIETLHNSNVNVDYAAFYTATSVFIPNTILSLGNYIFLNMSGPIYTDFESENDMKTKCTLGKYWNCYSFDYYHTSNPISNRKYTYPIYKVKSGIKTTSDNFEYFMYLNNVAEIVNYTGSDKTVVLPETINNSSSIQIGKSAFNNKTITSIIFSSSIIGMKEYAFQDCKKLLLVDYSESQITAIPQYAFSNCESLNTITPNNKVTSIGRYAFYGCSSLKNLVLDKTLISIDEYAFNSCTSLSTIEIPQTIRSFGVGAFLNCSSLRNIYFDGTIHDWCQIKFLGTSSSPMARSDYSNNFYLIDSDGPITYNNNSYSLLTNIDIPNTVTSINARQFVGFGKITSFTIPSTVTSIGYCAFYGCYSIEHLNIPDSIQSIEGWAFSQCSGLNEITLPNSVSSIGSYLFEDCTSLTSLDLSKTSIESIPEGICIDCNALCNVKFNDSITTIGNKSFSGCVSLDNVIIPDSVTFIDEDAFSNCTSLNCFVLGKQAVSNSSSYKNCPFTKDVLFFHGSIDEFYSLSVTFSYTFVNFYLDEEPTNEQNELLPSGSLYWHYVNGVPTLW